MPSSTSSSSHGGSVPAFERVPFVLPPQAAAAASFSCACCPVSGVAAAAAAAAAAASVQQQQQRVNNNNNNTPVVVLCPSCVNRYLQAARQRRQAVIKEHADLQRACREKFAPLIHNGNDKEDERDKDADVDAAACCNRLLQMQQVEWQQIWLPHWEYLRRVSSNVAVQVARIKFDNEQRNESLQIMSRQNTIRRQLLYRWKHALLLSTREEQQQDGQDEGKKIGGDGNDNNAVVLVNHSETGLGAMAMAVMEARLQVRRLRFQWALYAFQLHKLHVGDDHLYHNKNASSTSSKDTAAVCRGIGKIGGCLPLPHAGPELYVFLPPPELQSALRLVASLTSMVAACLGILLPHPILLQQQQQPSSSQHDSSTTKMMAAANSPTASNATPSTTSMRSTTSSFEYTYCRDLAMRAAAAASVEQPHDFYSHLENNEDWHEPFPNVTGAAVARTSSSSSTANKAATTTTLSTSYLLSLAGQTFRRATGGGGGTPNAAGAASTKPNPPSTVPATRTVAAPSNNESTHISTTTTRRQQEVVGSSHDNNNTILSMDPTSIERRIHHATAAVLAENEHGSLYTLAAPGTIISSSSSSTGGLENKRTTDEISSSDHSGVKKSNNNNKANQQTDDHKNVAVVVDSDHFAIALQLLQNDIICLCIRAGVPVTNLWPAQAVLLNLQALQEFCQEQTTTLSPVIVHRR